MNVLNSQRWCSIAGCSLVLVLFTSAAPAQTAQPSPGGIDGEKVFATSCGWCHQSGGRAQGRGPKLAGTDKSDEFIINRIKNGKTPGMPAFGRSFSDEQIQAIVAYIRGLSDKP
ncbi:c-type cytochrome [Microvirga massiliensis]|uniref:c-type cytochrome n=1 Tax=Microvirga massiliensis TaxID=1033741 RepID=UPI00062B67D0|nr:cytochrome c [Microvirga massiliensis]